MKIQLVAEAETELAKAIAYHEKITPGLGLRLKEEVRETILWIERHPDLLHLRGHGCHRVNLRVFPYFVAYTVFTDTLWILAIAHSHRRPGYWLRRRRRLA